MSWKPEVQVNGEWSRNGLAFATEKEALDNASDLMMRWTQVTDFRATESDEPVDYSYIDGHLKSACADSATD